MVLRIGMSKLAAACHTLVCNSSSPSPEAGEASGAVLLTQAQFLHSFGLDPSEVFSKLPQLRFIPVENMQAVADYLQKEGVDVKHVLKYNRQILYYRIPVLQEKVSFLRDSGMDAVKHINRCPNLLHFSVIRKFEYVLFQRFVFHF
eukprot:EG_transcript_23999